MCDCRKNIEEKLLAKFQEETPEAKDHSASLTGYALIFGDKLTEKGCMAIEMVAKHPLKKGGFKERKTKTNMMFTFCPFCAEKYV